MPRCRVSIRSSCALCRSVSLCARAHHAGHTCTSVNVSTRSRRVPIPNLFSIRPAFPLEALVAQGSVARARPHSSEGRERCQPHPSCSSHTSPLRRVVADPLTRCSASRRHRHGNHASHRARPEFICMTCLVRSLAWPKTKRPKIKDSAIFFLTLNTLFFFPLSLILTSSSRARDHPKVHSRGPWAEPHTSRPECPTYRSQHGAQWRSSHTLPPRLPMVTPPMRP